VAGVVDESSLGGERRIETIEHVVEGGGQLGDLV
jgi:hypothetical protein